MSEIKNKSKVVVLIPVYNTIEYLEKSINSVLSQTYSNLDIIIIDDCSTDGSYEYLQSLQDKRIRLYRNDVNQGVASTLNRGIELSNAQYIVRHDSDDVSYPDRIEKQIEFLDKHPDVHVLGTSFHVRHPDGTLKNGSSNSCPLLTFLECPVHHPTVAFRTKLVYENKLTYESVAEDYVLWNKIFKTNSYHRDTFFILEDVLVSYTARNSQVTNKNGNKLRGYKSRNQFNWVEGFLNFHEWDISFPSKWTVKDYNQFMIRWREWNKPQEYTEEEYDRLIKYFSWNILFYHFNENQSLRKLMPYIRYGKCDLIGILRIIKQAMEYRLNIKRNHFDD